MVVQLRERESDQTRRKGDMARVIVILINTHLLFFFGLEIKLLLRQGYFVILSSSLYFPFNDCCNQGQ